MLKTNRTILLAGVSLSMWSVAATAQTATPAAPADQTAPAPATPATTPADVGQQTSTSQAPDAGTPDTAVASGARKGSAQATAEDIVVTGSRVISNGNNSPNPITVLAVEKLATTTPSNIPDALRKLPVFGNSRSASNLGSAGANNVGNFLNLRAFGINRTLILFDGRRVPATNADGTVDTNTLPQLLLQRVDVVTGGASAVYGSDAVTGVVNFVLNNKFNGVKLTAQAGVSQFGDAQSNRIGFAAGTKLFGGRGHIEVSAEHFQQAGIGDKFDRAAGQKVYLEAGAGTAASPFHLVQDARASTSSFGGLIRSGVLAGQNFYADGLLRPFVHGTATGSTGIESGGEGSYNVDTSATASLQTDQAFGRFDYDLTDDVKFFVQVSGARSLNNTKRGPPTFANYTISADNAYLPASAKAALAAAGQTSFNFTRTVIDEPQYITDAATFNLTATTGLSGSLGKNFSWNAFYTFGRSRQRITAENNVNNGRLLAALDAVSVGGQTVCRVTITNPGAYPGCVPINLFGPTAESKAAYNYITGNTFFVLINKVQDVGGDISGTPFNTWAGPVKVAVSGEYRFISLDNTSNADPNAHPDCSGIRFNCSATSLLWLDNTRGPYSASESIAEGAIETNVPLVRDVPFIKSLDVNAAYRYAHYSVSGNAQTWKAGLDWHVSDDLSFRATRSRDIRAPTLFDLFAPVTVAFTGYTDLHTGLAQGLNVSTQGNPNLKFEIANTLTLGGVFKPHFIPRFSVSVDYFKIKIANAITSLGGNSIPTQQACEASGGTSPLCSFYVRPLPFSDHSAANFPTSVTSGSINAANTRTEGVDFEVNYAVPIASNMLSLRGLVTYQPILETTPFPGALPIVSAGVAGQQGQSGVAKVRASVFVGYSTDSWSLDVQERWRSAVDQNGTPGLVFSDPKVPAAAYTDLTYTMKAGDHGKFNFFISVQNLLNKQAPVFISTNFSSNPNFFYPAVDGDDFIGRYFTAGVRVAF